MFLQKKNYTLEDHKYFQERSLKVYNAYERRGLKIPEIVKTEITKENFLFHRVPGLLNYFINTIGIKFYQFIDLDTNTSLEKIGQTIKQVFEIKGLNNKIKKHIDFIIQLQNEKEKEDPMIKIEISKKSKEIARFVFEKLNKKLKEIEDKTDRANDKTELTKRIYEIIISEFKSRFEFK